ncbi:hypothetical protein EEJ42_32015 [Streptomyces botrytidirepellens]|uniref:Uncharacterized protein n=1 Tax=Streptomyces botrytidirepellens TaxID=2486417 RepID=A0A3M8V9C6_9ACTN|nr:hypothetical protein EEJ42_32015 [Streptomyces botrytidirepellens]
MVLRAVAPEYAYSGATRPSGRTIGRMLWSEPPDEPPEELRRAQAMLRRARAVLAIAIMIATCLLTLHP